jgi:predicted N-formylglutamate amidohydrolase
LSTRYDRAAVSIGLVLSCEHASWTLPPGVELGVPLDVLQSQASWDHGAYEIAARLGDATGIHVHAGAFSRMWVDLNRAPDHPSVIPEVSYGAAVPGNVNLTPGDRSARIEGFHAPYWNAVRGDVAARLHDSERVLHFSSHTFCPGLDPARRTFEVGVLYDPSHDFEAQLAERLLFAFKRAGIDVRANEPYTGVGFAICSSFRQQFGAPYAGIQLETSHAVTRSAGGCARIADAILPFFESLRA